MKVYLLTYFLVLFFGELAREYSLRQAGNGIVEGRAFHSPDVRRCFVVASLILIFVAGCRYEVGADYGGYYYGYWNYAGDLARSLRELDEPGIRLIYWITVRIWDDGAACVFAVAAVTIALELRMVYRNTDQVLMALLLFTLLVWDACFNGVRQALATAVLCCGFRYLREGKFWPYLIVVALAYLCHKSAAIMILPFFVCRWEINFRNTALLVVASVIVLFSMDWVFSFTGWLLNDSADVSAYYENSYWSNSINRWRVAAWMAPAVFFYAVYWKLDKTPTETFYLNLTLIHALVAIMTMNSTCLGRIAMYTSPYLVVAIPELTKRFEGRNKVLIRYGIVALYLAFSIVEMHDVTWNWIWNR